MQNEFSETLTYKLLEKMGSEYSDVFDLCAHWKSNVGLDLEDILDLEAQASENGHTIRAMGEFDINPITATSIVKAMLKDADDHDCLVLAVGNIGMPLFSEIAQMGPSEGYEGNIMFGLASDPEKATASLVMVVY